MLKLLEYLKLTPLYEVILQIYQKRELTDWKKRRKKPPTPTLIKQEIVKDLAKRYSLKTFVETGTYLGAMIDATLSTFEKIYTIELDPLLFNKAKRKFKNHRNVRVIKGDSAVKLLEILPKIKEPTLFWLDAHYSKGITAKGDLNTPILEELRVIINHFIKEHLILVDDASSFIGKNGFPTISNLKKYILKLYPNLVIETKHNIIFIFQKSQNITIL